jgi:hypothetical protein
VGGDVVLNAYNDVEVEVDERLEGLLLDRGVDAILARHVAHLFTRDPLVVFQVKKEKGMGGWMHVWCFWM